MSVSLSAETFNKLLNGFFEDRSFVSGPQASKADAEVFAALAAEPDASKLPHLARWFKYVKNHNDEIKNTEAIEEEEDDDDVDLFGSSDEDEDAEAERVKAERLAAYKAKKAAKGPGPVAKSMITLDVKPWDTETDMAELEKGVRAIKMDGLVWGKSQLLPVAFGVKKLRIPAVVEDAKVSTDDLSEKIEEMEDYVQSVDTASFQKL